MIKFKSLVIQLIFFGVLLGFSSLASAQCAEDRLTQAACDAIVFHSGGSCSAHPTAPGRFQYCSGGSSSSASSVPPPPPPSDCAPHLAKNSEGFCVCPNEGTQVDMNGSCQSTCPAGHDNSGMCYPEDCPWGEGTPAQCNDRTCSNEGHKSVEMLPGMWMCVKEIPDDDSGSSSSTGGGDDNNGGGDGDGDGGQSSSTAPVSCQNGEQWNGTQCVPIQQCPAGTAWGNVGGFWDCWSGWPDNNNGDCPEGQRWGTVNGVQGCWGQSGSCPPGQNYGIVNGVLGCHGQPIQSCPNGQIWGNVNGVQGCYGAPSCPPGFTHGTVNGVTTCWNNSGCDAVGNCASSRASSSAPNCPNGQVWNGAQCQLPFSSSGGSSGSGNGDGDGEGNSSSEGSGSGGGSGSSAGSGSSTGAGIGEGTCTPESQSAPNCTGDHDPITCAIAINTWQVECNAKLWRDDLLGDEAFNSGDTLLDGENPKNKISTVETSAFYDGADFNTERFGGNSSSCPADRSVSVLGGSISFTYSWICEFASLIRNIVLAIAYFVAALIYIRGFMGVTE